MATGGRRRTRSQRVASLELPPGRFERVLATLRTRDVLLKLAACCLAALIIWAVTAAWAIPFSYRVGYVPRHDVRSRVTFEESSPGGGQRGAVREAGEVLAPAGRPLTVEDVRLLKQEHEAQRSGRASNQRLSDRLHRSAAFFIFLAALFAMCGFYLTARDRQILTTPMRLGTVLFLAVLAITLAMWITPDPWRADVVPPLLFGMTVAIAFSLETALVLTTALTLVITVVTGGTLGDFLIQMSSVVTASLMCGHVRSRSKLIKVGLITGVVSGIATLGVGILEHQPLGMPLLTAAGRNVMWSVAAGFLMTGLLPTIERLFGVLTEISLLELGDVAHPLLQELVRRAPGTYNHSINVASLAEAAAEAIGANGLLVRVGAYFHDIGKMFKPGYFIENVGQDVNRHESLVPAMSTLIIIAHVKDGADLARQHHLPQPIIDFIEQHHGTTLVEYFYRRASQIRDSNPDASEVEENSFRYPGPKPQTKEAAVLMLSDAVEGACRVLVEPTPARIENLVHDLAMKRLLDGQFDECGLNLLELSAIEESLVKSLTAVYHGRVKYPDQRTA
ncbi:MAG: HDIG domain-containing protein [Pirellulales bacterium]|nr:HDIG domain-containing protein [Pirellulales bacterium]